VAHLGQAIYPELAKLSSQDDARAMRKLALRAAVVAGSTGLAAFAILAATGPWLIRWSVGAAYAQAYGLLVLLALAAAIGVFAFPVGPIMYALGRPHVLLRVTVVMSLVYLGLLVPLLWQWGLIGAGMAAVINAGIALGVLAVLLKRSLRRAGSSRLSAAP
ncbi:MAG: hypothetical protein D6826_11420, partial [Alphaproteobacteria bacterium]